MTPKHIFLILADTQAASNLDRNVLRPAGYQVTWIDNSHTAEHLIEEFKPDLVIMGDKLIDGDSQQLSATLLARFPNLPLILAPSHADPSWGLTALRQGFVDCLLPPIQPKEVLQAVNQSLDRRAGWASWAAAENRHTTSRLRRRVNELETLAQIGRTVTAQLDLDRVLETIVDAAVALTGAEEGNLLLVDEDSGDLYMRAARNFQDEFVRTFRLPIQDSLAGQVIASGVPILVDNDTPQKIKTSYLVHSLLYVPLKVHDKVIGVLGVDNRTGSAAFDDHHLILMSATADYAAIAIENARLYNDTELERHKLEAILTQIEDVVIVFDPEDRFLVVNRAARLTFRLGETRLRGKRLDDLLNYPDMVATLRQIDTEPVFPAEIRFDDGRYFNAQVVNIPDIGRAITLQDVTHFKELDNIKSEFVSTVSHDLRSPLTAILGYISLIERSGEINEQQLEYVQRVQISVRTITELIDKLLDIGQIEAGFDRQMERVALPHLIDQSIEGLRHHYTQKQQKIVLGFGTALPVILGNPLRLRQMFDNLIENAIKYTPQEGEVHIRARNEAHQVIIQVQDSGIGIPPSEQPYIFDKLYRASNVPKKAQGSGLGLSIVKSIVESHQGRIWAESTTGQGSTFTVVFPAYVEAEA